MNPDQLKPLDWQRILFGQNPDWFVLEIIGRALFIYVILLTCMRLMGRRVASQMGITELAVLITLGAAVGVPMQALERGVLPALAILTLAVLVLRGLNWAAAHSSKVELLTQGDVIAVVEDGRLLLHHMEKVALSREKLFAVLRAKGVEHLGQVRRVYMETSGQFSVFLNQEPEVGLLIMPAFDARIRALAPKPGDRWACLSCGHVVSHEPEPGDPCRRCGHHDWTEACLSIKEGTPAYA